MNRSQTSGWQTEQPLRGYASNKSYTSAVLLIVNSSMVDSLYAAYSSVETYCEVLLLDMLWA